MEPSGPKEPIGHAVIEPRKQKYPAGQGTTGVNARIFELPTSATYITPDVEIERPAVAVPKSAFVPMPFAVPVVYVPATPPPAMVVTFKPVVEMERTRRASDSATKRIPAALTVMPLGP